MTTEERARHAILLDLRCSVARLYAELGELHLATSKITAEENDVQPLALALRRIEAQLEIIATWVDAADPGRETVQ